MIRFTIKCLLVILSIAWTVPVLAQSSRTITVHGEGMATSSPNMAVIRSGVISQAVSPSDAIAANNLAMSKLFTIARQFGIDDRDIQTSQFSLAPDYKRGENQSPPQISGYRVSNQFTARLRDIPKLGEFLDELVRGGANHISGISFEIEDAETLHTLARQRAVSDARSRAETYAKEFAMTVGAPVSIAENHASIRQPAVMRTMSMQMAEQVPVAPGERTVFASVTVVFSVE